MTRIAIGNGAVRILVLAITIGVAACEGVVSTGADNADAGQGEAGASGGGSSDGGMAGSPSDGARPDASGREAGSPEAGPASDGGSDAGTAPALSAGFTTDRSASPRLEVDASGSSGDIVDYAWDFGDGQSAAGIQVAHVYASTGCYEVRLTVTDRAGNRATAARTLRVVVERDPFTTVEDLVFPESGSLIARLPVDPTATFQVSASSLPSFEQALVRVWQDNTLYHEVAVELCSPSFQLDAVLEVRRMEHRVELAFRRGGEEVQARQAMNVVAGDAYIITGQSNSVAREREGSAEAFEDPFVRTFGSQDDTDFASTSWATAAAGTFGPAWVGQWGAVMAAGISRTEDVPLLVLNGARGGRPISYFQRNDADPLDPTTNYAATLRRARLAGVADRIRAILWYQGESDGANATEHRDGFLALHDDWSVDYPNVERIYVTQIRQGGCGGELATREIQRGLPTLRGDIQLMSTTGLDGHDGCHYAFVDGYRELGQRYERLLRRDLYGEPGLSSDIEPIDVASVTLEGDQLRVETRSDASAITVDSGVEVDFFVDGGRTVQAVTVAGTTLRVTLAGSGSAPTQLSYRGHAGSGPWITNALGVGMLTFQVSVQ